MTKHQKSPIIIVGKKSKVSFGFIFILLTLVALLCVVLWRSYESTPDPVEIGDIVDPGVDNRAIRLPDLGLPETVPQDPSECAIEMEKFRKALRLYQSPMIQRNAEYRVNLYYRLLGLHRWLCLFCHDQMVAAYGEAACTTDGMDEPDYLSPPFAALN